jgi:hypothetical protein
VSCILHGLKIKAVAEGNLRGCTAVARFRAASTKADDGGASHDKEFSS